MRYSTVLGVIITMAILATVWAIVLMHYGMRAAAIEWTENAGTALLVALGLVGATHVFRWLMEHE